MQRPGQVPTSRGSVRLPRNKSSMAATRAVINPSVTGHKSTEDGHLSGGVPLRVRRDVDRWSLCPQPNHGDLFPMSVGICHGSPVILGCVKLIIRTNTTFLPPLHFPYPNSRSRQSLRLSLATAAPAAAAAAAPESSVMCFSAAPMLEVTQG